MENNFHKELLGQITDLIQNEAKTETLVGEPFQLGDFTCVPVIRMGMGLGAGGGEGSDSKKGSGTGGGAGAGFGVEPMGFLVSRQDKIEFISTHSSKGIASAFEKVPHLLDRYMDMKNKKKETA